MSELASTTFVADRLTRFGFIAKASTALVSVLAVQLLHSKTALAYCAEPFGCFGPGGCCHCSSYSMDNGACCWQICINQRIYFCCDYNETGDPTCQCRFYGGFGC